MSIEFLKKLANDIEEEESKKKDENDSSEIPQGEEEPATQEETDEPEEAAAEQQSAGPVDPLPIMEFFKQQGPITDAAFHSFCEQNGYNVHQAEAVAYKLAQKAMTVLGGGNGAGIDPNQVDPQQLEMGMQIESKHTACPAIQKKLALDNLAIDPQYYSNEIFQQELQGGTEQPVQPDQSQQPLGQQKLAAAMTKTAKKRNISRVTRAIQNPGKKV